jgi:2-oxoacid:acceptor oxidoreductase delta subunit (pyruvate/2-ketoisovalerate family)
MKRKDVPEIAVAFEHTTWNKTGSWRVFRPLFEKEKCIKCMLCWKFCPEGVIELKEDYPEIDYDYCKGCGICANECPKGAIEMVEE